MDSDLGDISVTQSSTVVLITLRRPKKLNALSKKMLHLLHPIVKEAALKRKKLIFVGEGPNFCCGGDLIHMFKDPPNGNHYLRVEYQLFLRIAQHPTTRAVFMTGYTLGSGAGFSYLSNIRISTNSTQWGFPECANGSIPDLGATFILGNIAVPGIGLFLSLTGMRINGADCYYLGLATHYISSDSRLPGVINEMLETGDLWTVVRKYQEVPDINKCVVFRDREKIGKCFAEAQSVEDILSRLHSFEDLSWSLPVLQSLRDNCPYVVKIAYRCLKSSTSLTYTACLQTEFTRDCNVYDKRYRNYHIGITHKFVEKRQGRPPWIPETLEQVTDSEVTEFFDDTALPPLGNYD